MIRLLVIDPAISQVEEECAQIVLAHGSTGSTLLRPALDPGDLVDASRGYDHDACVLLGSRASVHDDLPWARALSAWLGPILAGEVELPLLGVCYGHQLFAHLLGGQVGFVTADRGKRQGVEPSTSRGSRLLPDGDHPVVVSHQEAVHRPPPGWRVTASRAGVRCDAMEHPERAIFGVQDHPEARGEFLAERGFDPGLADSTLCQGMDGLFARFCELAAGSRSGS